ncbi:unnamed protein product [Bursaphelenchus xylophilus]|uniref:(pine wood nematode) hypothetical protein n=1 Tax=Bursaphelenchus xylophilus TaxID=6326 RepID=A0A1I7SJ68_BURXY|nr:unnamed protein product [Bursaphelenchus xylophilus]CAG9109946.1 unnamed protein product [Bursaphelenchus xylophilus]
MLSKVALLIAVLLISQQCSSWSVDLNDPTVQRFAREAVEIANKKDHWKLTFHQVLSAKRISVSGYIYHIVLDAFNVDTPVEFPHFVKINDTVRVFEGKETHKVVVIPASS